MLQYFSMKKNIKTKTNLSIYLWKNIFIQQFWQLIDYARYKNARKNGSTFFFNEIK